MYRQMARIRKIEEKVNELYVRVIDGSRRMQYLEAPTDLVEEPSLLSD